MADNNPYREPAADQRCTRQFKVNVEGVGGVWVRCSLAAIHRGPGAGCTSCEADKHEMYERVITTLVRDKTWDLVVATVAKGQRPSTITDDLPALRALTEAYWREALHKVEP